MNTSLLLIRHGDVIYVDRQGRERPELIYNGDTAQLTDLGREQLQNLGGTLLAEGLIPDSIVTSDFRRAVDSTEALKEGLGKRVWTFREQNLRDVIAPGWDGLPKEEFVRLTNGDIYSFAPQTPEQEKYMLNQETLENIITRQRNARYRVRSELVSNHFESRDTLIAVVGHGDALSAFHWEWTHEENELPTSYWEMKDSFYLDKAEAHLLTLDPSLRIVGEGRRIRIPEVDASVEGWRNQGKEK